MKKYEILIFDLDDTLINNHKAMEYSFLLLIKEFQLSAYKFEELMVFERKF